jgi:outer membrane protein assembly factor BamB
VEHDYRLPGNGRIISLWAVRTGIVVVDDIAYFATGLFPNEGVHACAVRAADGEPVWRTRIADRPAQGYLLASQTRLYVPTGRENPLVFDRRTGASLRAVDGGGGSYALLTGDTLIFGPGRHGELGVVAPEQKEQLATFAGSQVLVDGERFYLLGQGQLRALERGRYLELSGKRRVLTARQAELAGELQKLGKSAASAKGARLAAELAKVQTELAEVTAGIKKCMRWQSPCEQTLSLILAGDVLFAGGEGIVTAYRADHGKQVWTAKVDGGAYGLAAGGGRLLVSTDQGSIHCFEPAGK